MKQRNKRKARRDIYQEVTDKIIGHLERGTAPWRNPIQRGTGDGWPKNLDSGKRYRGINVFLLGLTSWERGYSSDFWMTFKQAAAAGGQVRKGEKGSLVTFWKMYATKDRETGLDVEIPMLKHYTAFNLDQIEGIDAPDAPETPSDGDPFEPIVSAERIVDGYAGKPMIAHDGGGRAFYRPSTDTIHMPDQRRFENPESYYSTLFHEITHSTGHSKRLDRGLDTKLAPFGSNDYSKEELVAEMGAAFLSASAGISPPTIEQSASYLQSWINVLRGDKRLVVTAAASAQKAADLVLGTTFETASTPTQKIAASQPRIDDLEQSVKKPADSASIQLDLF